MDANLSLTDFCLTILAACSHAVCTTSPLWHCQCQNNLSMFLYNFRLPFLSVHDANKDSYFHICRVRKQIVNVPSFVVRLDSQKHIDFALTSPFGGGRQGRVKRKNQRKAEARGGESEEEDEDWGRTCTHCRVVCWMLCVRNKCSLCNLLFFPQILVYLVTANWIYHHHSAQWCKGHFVANRWKICIYM